IRRHVQEILAMAWCEGIVRILMTGDDMLKVEARRCGRRVRIEGIKVRSVPFVDQRSDAAQDLGGLGIIAENHLQIACADCCLGDGIAFWVSKRHTRSKKECWDCRDCACQELTSGR